MPHCSAWTRLAPALCLAGAIGPSAHAATGTPAQPYLAEVQATYKAGRTSEALRQLDALISLHPRDAQLRFQKGVMLVDQKRPNEAIQVFQKLVQDYPSLPEPLNNLAVLYVERGDMEKARTTLEAAIRSKPNYGTAFQNLGDLYTRMASRAYARALQIDDADGAPKLALIRSLYEPPELDVSAALVAKAASAVPVAKPPAASVKAPASAVVAPQVVVATAPSAASPAPPVVAKVPKLPSAPAAASASPPARPASTVAAARPAASAPAARPPKTVAPAPAAPQAAAEDAEINAAVHAWAQAWSRRDMAGYIGAYVPGFKGSDASAEAWQAARRARILGKNNIKVEVSGLKVEMEKGVARASFRQSYSGGALEVSSRKTLEFTKLNGRWLIRRESVGG